MTTQLARAERPVTAYRVLERRATGACLAVLLALAALAWWSTARSAAGMEAGDMAMPLGLAAVGTTMMPFDMAAGVFLGMWVTMMVAMMFPTIAPIVLLHRMVLRRAGVGPLPTAAFGLGYLAVWSAFGLVPLAILLAFREVAHGAGWVAPLAGAVLVVAGLYQFSPWKGACLRTCQSPLRFLTTHHFGVGSPGAFRTGLAHGAWCLGCCWALMAVLFVVGLMNLVWMAAISAVFVLEKHTTGMLVPRAVGTVVALLGVAVLLEPAVLEWATGTM